jgi:hypothetical protein
MFGMIVIFAIIEVIYLFFISSRLSYMTYIVDVYSGLDNCQIQFPSQFPEHRSSGSRPLHVVRVYLDGSVRFYIFDALLSYGWKLDHWRCFSLRVVCLIVLRIVASHSSVVSACL